MKKLMTIEDLYDYYSNHKKSVHYNAEESNRSIAVQVEANLCFKKDDYDAELGLLKCHAKSMHIGDNRNHSRISQEVLEQAIPSFYNRPVLGYIHKLDQPDKNGNEYQFAGHEMFVNSQGEIEYEEQPVGVIPESANVQLVYDKDMDKTYVELDLYIFEEYSRAAEILRNEGESKVSIELCLLDFSYNAKDKFLEINKMYVSGLTILGVDRNDNSKKIEEGMLGSKVMLKDFSKNESFETEEMKEKLIEMQESINILLSRFNIEDLNESNKTYRKEDEIEVEEKDILVNEEVTETETVVEVEEVEETTVVVNETETNEVTEENVEETVEVTETESTEEVTETEAEESEDPAEDETPEVVETASEEENEEIENNEDEAEKFELIEKSFEVDGRKFSISFELSHGDIAYGLYTLLESYCELDNDWYDIRAVYDDRFVFQGWFTGKIYGQKYTKDGDTVALDGERFELFEELLTVTEKSELESMRSNYSSVQTELNSYKTAELNAKKEAIFADEAYTNYLNDERFVELKANLENYSLEELEKECSLAFAECVKKSGSFSLNNTVSNKPNFVAFAATTSKEEGSNAFLDGLRDIGRNKR